MSIIHTLNHLSSAEEFFETLDVAFEPQIVRVARLHILRRMGQYLRDQDFSGQDEAAVKQSCRTSLEQAYQDFVTSTPLEERLFKVHKDAIKPKEEPKSTKAFVPLTSLNILTP
jgi:nitrogenase-stabilizing/protective protein